MNITNIAKTLKQYLGRVAPAYLEDSVPTGTVGPYCTFSLTSEDYFNEGLIQVRIYSESRSIEEVCRLTDKLDEAIGGGVVVDGVDGGYLWLYKGSPFAQIEPTGDEELKAMYINIIFRQG